MQAPAREDAKQPGQKEPKPLHPSEPGRTMSLPVALLKAMRPKQWTKNVLLFAALLFALEFTNPDAIWRAFAGFFLFCLFSSAVYLINDLRDRERDALNPRTRNRPIASGALKPRMAVAAVAFILPVAFILSWFLSPWFAAVGAIYMAKDFAYSFGLKHVVIIDVFLIAAGFTLRAVAGALAIGAPISPWLYVVTSLGALFLGLNKRKHELLLLGAGAGSHRRVLDEYSPALVDEMLAVITASTVMSYGLYTFTADNLPQCLRDNHLMMLTIPFVLYGIFRYLYLVFQKNEGSSPEEVLLRDRPLLICVVLWGLTSATLLYVFSPLSGLACG
ncbi:MAG: decaprenyl-phosphate phosphoribosyltransferase [Chloroflexia bacterium]